MARTPSGPALAKPLSGLSGGSNISPHEFTDFTVEMIEAEMKNGGEPVFSFEDWLYKRKVDSWAAIAPHPDYPEDPPLVESLEDADLVDPLKPHDDYDDESFP